MFLCPETKSGESRVILSGMSWNGRPFGGDIVGKDCQLPLRSPRIDLFESVELYSEESIEMPICQWHWGRYCTDSQVSSDRGLWVGKVIFRRWSLNGKWIGRCWERDCIFIIKVSQDTELFQMVELYLGGALDWSFISGTGEQNLHIHYLGLSGHRALLLGRVILRRWLWNGRLLTKYWGIDCKTFSGLMGQSSSI